MVQFSRPADSLYFQHDYDTEDSVLKMKFTTLTIAITLLVLGACSKPAESTNTAKANSNAAKPATETASKPATETASKPAQGDDNVFTNQEAGVTFTVPAGWKAEPNNEQIQVSSPDGSVTIVMWVPEEDSFQEASKAIGDQIDKQLQNVKTDGDGDTVKINGMDAFELTGSGTYEGTAVKWAVDLIKAKKPFIALSIGESEKLQQHMDAYKALVGSIKPI